jgi:SAM-dependent methyltransferase
MNILRDFKKSVIRTLRPPSFDHHRSTRPVSDVYGFDRGRPIDRHYIDRFIAAHAADIRGDVLEVQDLMYTQKHGSNLSSRQVLDIDPGNENATLVADLAAADHVASDSFDCILLPQTLQFIYEVRAAVYHAHRMLRPGGVLLATLPALARADAELYTSDFWRFTPASAERLFAEQFGPVNLMVASYGNALACAAFVYGMSVEEFSAAELDPIDSYFPLILTVRARKAEHPSLIEAECVAPP